METILAELGISVHLLLGPDPLGTWTYYYLESDAATGLQIVEEINRLHHRLGDDVWFDLVSNQCPSGGGPGGPGTLSVLEIPTLGGSGLAVLAALLAAGALRSLRTPPPAAKPEHSPESPCANSAKRRRPSG